MVRSPAGALAWEIWRRHRWGLVAILGEVVALAALRAWLAATGRSLVVDSGERFAMLVMVPLTAASLYLLAIFSFGIAGDLAGRRSTYPARLFTLPVSNATLVGQPMLMGGGAIALLWLAVRALALWPPDVQVPLVWPALLGAVLLAWVQALTWMPYGLPGVRVVAAMLWLASMDTIVLLALHYRAQERTMLLLLAPQLPLAYAVARVAVARARRGEEPDWRGAFRWLAPALPHAASTASFRSAADAQAWLEWRRRGRTLPVMVALVLPFQLLVLPLVRDTERLVLVTVIGALLVPPIFAGIAAADGSAVGGGLPTFIATRPLTDAALLRALLRMTVRSTLLAWLPVLVALPVALRAFGLGGVVARERADLVDTMGSARATVLVLVIVGACVLSTWRQLAQSLYVGLAGRAWLRRTSVFVAVLVVCLAGPALLWTLESDAALAWLWTAVPRALSVLVALRLATAAWLVVRLHRDRLVGDRALVASAAAWTMTVLALYAVLVWFWDTPVFPHHLLALVAIAFVPLVRPLAAPLALHWGRHR